MKTEMRMICAVMVFAAAISTVPCRCAEAQSPSAARAPGFVAPQLPVFQCTGNEPFWNLNIVKEDAVLGRPEAAERVFRGELTWLEHSGIYAWNGRAQDGRGDKLEALIEERRCRDATAGELFPYRVRVALPGEQRVEGCCRTDSVAARPMPVPQDGGAAAAAESAADADSRGRSADAFEAPDDAAGTDGDASPEPAGERPPELAAQAMPPTVVPPPAATEPLRDVPLPPGEAPVDEKAEDDWARFLGELLPAIDVCLGRVDDSGAAVATASVMSDGSISVRIIDRESRRWDCFAPATAHTVNRLEPVDADAPRLPGEGSPLFTRAGGRPPRGECLRTEIISDETGRRVGWLSYKIC